MYKVKMDGLTLYYPGDKEAALINPVLRLQAGHAGTFEAIVPPGNPAYSKVINRRSMVSVYQDGKEIFFGEVRKVPKKDRYNNKTIYCAGAMSFLADSIQPQAEYHDKTPRQMLQIMLNEHNRQVEDRKKIYIGQVTVKDANDSLYRYTNYEDTLKAIREKLVERLGGYLRLRHTNGKLYLDWVNIEEYGKYCEQPIEFGLNLLDYSESRTAENVVTALIPLGARLEGESDIEALEKYVDITSVNGGSNYIYSKEAVENFGWVWATNTWQDVTEPSNLMRKAKDWMESNQFEDMTLTLTAVDLSDLDSSYEKFESGDRVPCRAKPYGMNTVLPILEMVIPLAKPDERKLTLSNNQRMSYTEQQSRILSGMTADAQERKRIQNEAVKSAIDNLTAQMTGSKGGYKLTEFDENGQWVRDLYMDAPDKAKATNILQINANGIGGSHNGYKGPYAVGMTLDGQIIGERITANSVGAEKLTVEYKSELEGKFQQVVEDAEGYTNTREQAVKELITTSIRSMEERIEMSVLDQKSITNRYDYITGGDNQTVDAGAFVAEANLTKDVQEAAGIKAIHVKKTDGSAARITQSLGELPAGTYTVEFKINLKSGTKLSSCSYGFRNYTSYKLLSTLEQGKWYTVSQGIKLTSKSEKEFLLTFSGASGCEAYITDIRVLRNIKELIDDVDARITVEAGKITQSVTEIYEANQHNYCEGGAFPDDFDGNNSTNWYRSNTSIIKRTTYKNRTCVAIDLTNETSTGSYVRIRDAIKVPKTGKFTIRFKAAASHENARARITFYNSKYTTAGDIAEDWKTIELTVDTVYSGNRYLYLYNYTTGGILYITDVEILGYASHYNEAKLVTTANDITAEVTRAKKAEDTMKASIKVNADSITSKVSKGQISSLISQEAGSITIKSNRLKIESTNFSLTASGYVTMKGASCEGTFSAKNGDWYIEMSSAEIRGGYKGTQYGYIDFYGGYNNTEEKTLRIAGNTCVDIKGKLSTARGYSDGTVWNTKNGDVKFITDIKDIGNGNIQWTWTTYSFVNGMLLG